MAKGLEPVPGTERPDLSKSIKTIAGSKLATYREYEDVLADRPAKFIPKEVDYKESKSTERCGICFHFFRQAGGRQRTVCEVVRDDNQDINPLFVCRFFTVDAKTYPLLDGQK